MERPTYKPVTHQRVIVGYIMTIPKRSTVVACLPEGSSAGGQKSHKEFSSPEAARQWLIRKHEQDA